VSAIAITNQLLVHNEERPDAEVRLFCFPYAGSSAQLFLRWSDYVPEWIAVSGFEMPAHGRRLCESKAIADQTEAATYIADALMAVVDRPYALFGHCLGSALAYEATRILQTRGGPQPLHFFSSGARAPHLGLPIANVNEMNDEDFIEHFGNVYGAPLGLLNDPQMRPYVLPMVRADARMTQDYHYDPGPPVTYGITAVAGEDDPDVELEHLNEWRRHTTASVSTRLYPGNHFFFVEAAEQLMSDFTDEIESHLT
jgi:medium-chain acyl-[acyl-carrier-protein] hydrolase